MKDWMTDLIAVFPDLVIVGAAAVFAAKSFMRSRSAKPAYIARGFLIVGLASVLFFLAEVLHLLGDAGYLEEGFFYHDLIEALFVVVLAAGILKFYPSWVPR